VNPRMALRSRLNLGNPLSEGHPQTVAAVRTGGDYSTRRYRQARRRQELERRDLALKPFLGIVVKRDRAGHHARNHWCWAKMYQHIACGVDDDCVIGRDPVGSSDRAGGRDGASFESGGHSEHCRTPNAQHGSDRHTRLYESPAASTPAPAAFVLRFATAGIFHPPPRLVRLAVMTARVFPVAYASDVEAVASFWELVGFRRHVPPPPDGEPGSVAVTRAGGGELAVTHERRAGDRYGLSPRRGARCELYIGDREAVLARLIEAKLTVFQRPNHHPAPDPQPSRRKSNDSRE
jgi:hypothetical protein